MTYDGTDADLTREIISAAIEVHKFFGGPGLLESVYERALCAELRSRGFHCERQVECPIVYKNQTFPDPFRIDLLVENRIIVECKAAAENNRVFAAQCLTYLKLKNLQVGLVVNFGLPMLKDGIERVSNFSK